MARILIIDDDELLRSVLAKSLTHAGHFVVEAMDGQQGVELSRVTGLDLVITDLVMPVQEGVETIVTLRKEQPKLPIIAMSGGVANSKLYLDIAGRIGAKRLLAKPFKPSDLLAAINEILSPTGQSAAPNPTTESP